MLKNASPLYHEGIWPANAHNQSDLPFAYRIRQTQMW